MSFKSALFCAFSVIFLMSPLAQADNYCDASVQGLKAAVTACMTDGSNMKFCYAQYSDQFLKALPECKFAAMPLCLQACQADGSNAHSCAQQCAK